MIHRIKKFIYVRMLQFFAKDIINTFLRENQSAMKVTLKIANIEIKDQSLLKTESAFKLGEASINVEYEKGELKEIIDNQMAQLEKFFPNADFPQYCDMLATGLTTIADKAVTWIKDNELVINDSTVKNMRHQINNIETTIQHQNLIIDRNLENVNDRIERRFNTLNDKINEHEAISHPE